MATGGFGGAAAGAGGAGPGAGLVARGGGALDAAPFMADGGFKLPESGVPAGFRFVWSFKINEESARSSRPRGEIQLQRAPMVSVVRPCVYGVCGKRR